LSFENNVVDFNIKIINVKVSICFEFTTIELVFT
jgi:hypothetical protein